MRAGLRKHLGGIFWHLLSTFKELDSGFRRNDDLLPFDPLRLITIFIRIFGENLRPKK
jgi:hypothetical protein